MSAHDAMNRIQFFHGTDSPMKPGDKIYPAATLAAQRGVPVEDVQRNSNEYVGSSEHTYASSDLREATGWGSHVYPVAPSGPPEKNPDAISDNDYRFQHSLTVLPHTPETAKADHDKITAIRGFHADMQKRFPGNTTGWWNEPVL